ncbi:hypothetical protein BH23PAT2_BH23PAT2_03290 [soil metagenome]
MKTIAIVGYGRFGELLASLCSGYFNVHVIEPDDDRRDLAAANGHTVLNLDQLNRVDFVFLAVPISELEKLLAIVGSSLNENQVIIDLCSVKVHPVALMKKYVKNAQILATHPMFGPDSASSGLSGLQVALCPVSINQDNLKRIQDFWAHLDVITIETTPEEHDKDTVYSQAFTYSLAKLIIGTDIPGIMFTTRSFNAIYKVAALSAKDTDQLFHDMLFYNPYFTEMKAKLEDSILKTVSILDQIADEQASSDNF